MFTIGLIVGIVGMMVLRTIIYRLNLKAHNEMVRKINEQLENIADGRTDRTDSK